MKTVVILVCLVAAVYATTTARSPLAGCPANLPRDEFLVAYGDYCFQFVKHELTWVHSRAECQGKGGDLAAVRNAAAQNFFYNAIKHWDNHGVWIGATDNDQEGVWEWVSTDDHITYSNWHPGQGPGHHGFLFGDIGASAEDCAQMRLDDHGLWHDYPCNGGTAYQYAHICEFAKWSSASTSTLPMMETPAPTTALPNIETPVPTTALPNRETPAPTTSLPNIETPAPSALLKADQQTVTASKYVIG